VSRPILLITVALLFAVAVLWWDRSESLLRSSAQVVTSDAMPRMSDLVQPLPRTLDLDPEVVALGARLFGDPRLSRDGSISCASCHELGLGGADGRARPIGIDDRVGAINTPTVFNSGFSFRQYWDGRVQTLEEQIDGPLENPAEMDSNWTLALERISKDARYQEAFEALYADGITETSVKNAVATFERSLITPDSRFDRFLRGDAAAMNADEARGYDLFRHYGCSGCHQGMMLGGNMFQRLGIVRDYFAERGAVEEADLGRFNVTGEEADRHVFKVPSLRNVALTAPYFHDGSAPTLPDAVRMMARYQLGREIPDDEVALIAVFLETLTGELQVAL